MANLKSKTNTAQEYHSASKNMGDPECDYETIASVDKDYTKVSVIHRYATLPEARSRLTADIKKWKDDIQNDMFRNFGIREVPKEA